MTSYINELERFKKSFLLHSSRYNLYSRETLVKGSTKTHNHAVQALGKLADKVVNTPSLYSDLLLELLHDGAPKVSLCAGYICLKANIHADKAIDRLKYIANNTPDISLICDFDIRGNITKFRKMIMDTTPHNEIDEFAEKMACSVSGMAYTDAELLEMALDFQDIDMYGHDGKTPLIHACIFNRFELAKGLIERGADVNKQDFYQKSALHCAIITGSIEIITLLLNHQANVNEQDGRGFTALDFAKGNFTQLSQNVVDELINLLIRYGAKTKQEL